MSKTSVSDIPETREGTARIEISCSVKADKATKNVGSVWMREKNYSSLSTLAPREERLKSLTQEDSLILIDWFENRTHSKTDVRFCSITEHD